MEPITARTFPVHDEPHAFVVAMTVMEAAITRHARAAAIIGEPVPTEDVVEVYADAMHRCGIPVAAARARGPVIELDIAQPRGFG